MKISNKQEVQQIVFNNSSDIDFQDFMNLYKKCTAKPCSFLVIDATFASGNLLCFKKEKQFFRKNMKTNYDSL